MQLRINETIPEIPSKFFSVEPERANAGETDERQGAEDGSEWVSGNDVSNTEKEVGQKGENLLGD